MHIRRVYCDDAIKLLWAALLEPRPKRVAELGIVQEFAKKKKDRRRTKRYVRNRTDFRHGRIAR